MSHRKVIDRLYNNIVFALSDAAIKSYRRKKGRRKGFVAGWNENVQKAHKEARLSFQTWLLNDRPMTGILYTKMKEDKKIFKSRLKFCMKHKDQIVMDRIASQHAEKDFKQFWKSTAKLNTRPSLPESVNGLTDDRDIAQLFMNHFMVSAIPLPADTCSVSQGDVRHVINTEDGESGELVRFTAKDVANAIKNMNRGRSPGHDGLSIEHMLNAGSHLPRVLAMFYTFCIGHSYLPQNLTKTIVVPIIKNKTGDVSDKENYRPISLATIAAKILDSLLDGHLNKTLHLHDAQFGFQAGVSTESAILSLKHTVKYYTERKTAVYACFLDLSKAFDRVSYQLLWDKLTKVLPRELVNIFQYWYGNQLNSVRWSGSLSDSYELECGVRQGGLTSPKLFNLYMNELIVELSNRHAGCSIDGVMMNNISYADDMVLLSPSISGIRDLLGVCETFASRHGLVYNTKKSEVLVFTGNNKRPDCVPPVRLNGKVLNNVIQFKYLGHIVTADLKDDCDIERERRALAVRGNMVARRFARCSIPVKVTLFKAFCQSFYTSNLWVKYTQKSLSALRVQYNNIFRMLLGLPRFCSASGMFADARTDGFAAIIRKRTVSLMGRVRGSHNSLLKTIADKYDCPILRHWVKTVVYVPT